MKTNSFVKEKKNAASIFPKMLSRSSHIGWYFRSPNRSWYSSSPNKKIENLDLEYIVPIKESKITEIIAGKNMEYKILIRILW